MPAIKTCESIMEANYKAIKRLRIYVLALALAVLWLVVQGCSGGSDWVDPGSGYQANGCYCKEGYRLARGNGTEVEAEMACAKWPGWGYLEDAFYAFVVDPDVELFCAAPQDFAPDEIQSYLDQGFRVSMNYPILVGSACDAPAGENCNHYAPVWQVSDMFGKDVQWICVAGDFAGSVK